MRRSDVLPRLRSHRHGRGKPTAHEVDSWKTQSWLGTRVCLMVASGTAEDTARDARRSTEESPSQFYRASGAIGDPVLEPNQFVPNGRSVVLSSVARRRLGPPQPAPGTTSRKPVDCCLYVCLSELKLTTVRRHRRSQLQDRIQLPSAPVSGVIKDDGWSAVDYGPK